MFAYLGNDTLLACLHSDVYLFHSDSLLQLLQPVNKVVLVTWPTVLLTVVVENWWPSSSYALCYCSY